MNARERIVLAAGRLMGEDLLGAPAASDRPLERFAEIYRHAYENVPDYRRKYEAAGLPARLSGDPAELRRVPPLTKEELRSRRLVPAEPGFSVRLRSGGTAGASSNTYLGPRYVLKRYGMLLRILYALGWEMGRPISALHPVEYRLWSNLPSMLRAGEASQAVFEFVQQSIVYRLFHNRRNVYYSGDVFELGGRGLLDQALRGGPSLLISRPDVLSSLLKDGGAHTRPAGPSAVLLVGSLAVAPAMARVRDFFGCGVVNMYASTEAGYVGLSCPHSGDRVHVDEAEYLVEIDADSDGEVLVTDFNNRGMPLIRYRTGDEAEGLFDEFCERFAFDRGRARCDLSGPLRRSPSGKLQCIA